MTSQFTEIPVVGDDKTGLIANVISLLFERGINIEDLDQGPITQRAFDVPDDADEATLKERGQPLEANALRAAVRLHHEDDVYVHHGRTSLTGDADLVDYQLGLPPAADDGDSQKPVDDGLVEPIND